MMELSTGLAIAGVWIGCGMIGSSQATTNSGMVLALIAAVTMTVVIL